MRRLNAYGAQAFFVPVAVKLSGSDYQAAADDPKLADLVRSANGAFFAGGDQSRITRALRHEDGSNTRVLDALWDMYRRGGVIAGSSAGAAIMSSTMFGRPRAVLATLKLGVEEGKEITDGLGFIGDDVFVDQHLLVRGRFARMLPAMLKKGYKLGLGIDEDTAMVVLPNRDVEVVGYKGALVLDLADATRAAKAPSMSATCASATSTMATASISSPTNSRRPTTRPTASSTRRGRITASRCSPPTSSATARWST